MHAMCSKAEDRDDNKANEWQHKRRLGPDKPDDGSGNSSSQTKSPVQHPQWAISDNARSAPKTSRRQLWFVSTAAETSNQ